MTEQNTGWRDISTAPKDGTVILLAAHDIHGHSDPGGPRKMVRSAYWHDGIGRDGGWSSAAFTTRYPPTHWQPLPTPPGEEATEAMQDARRSSIQSLIQKGIERDEEMRALQARCDKLEAATLNVLAHLSAAVSVIKTSEENGNHPSCAYGSDTMYRMAMKDFQKSMESGRESLRSVVEGGK